MKWWGRRLRRGRRYGRFAPLLYGYSFTGCHSWWTKHLWRGL
jgi:hypothetical protein